MPFFRSKKNTKSTGELQVNFVKKTVEINKINFSI